MTPTATLVRAACDADVAASLERPVETICPWPRCDCMISEDVMQRIVFAAEALGAEKEREACAANMATRAEVERVMRDDARRLQDFSMSTAHGDRASAFVEAATAIRRGAAQIGDRVRLRSGELVTVSSIQSGIGIRCVVQFEDGHLESVGLHAVEVVEGIRARATEDGG